jgi:nucleotide-binding universal stress UspA family protein
MSMAASCGAELVLYAAHTDGTDGTVLLHTARHMDHLFAIASELGIPVNRINEVGSLIALLAKRLESEKADLVFYPLTPYKRYGADRQRQMVHDLLKTISSDLAIVRAVSMARPHPGHILVPLGKSVSDMDSRLMFVSEMAGSFHAQVTLLHLTAEAELRAMPDEITQFGKQLERQQVKVHERLGSGKPGKAITVEAVTRQHDLIVMGASGRGVLRRLLFGSPAGDVMHQPPCNTILFRAALHSP